MTRASMPMPAAQPESGPPGVSGRRSDPSAVPTRMSASEPPVGTATRDSSGSQVTELAYPSSPRYSSCCPLPSRALRITEQESDWALRQVDHTSQWPLGDQAVGKVCRPVSMAPSSRPSRRSTMDIPRAPAMAADVPSRVTFSRSAQVTRRREEPSRVPYRSTLTHNGAGWIACLLVTTRSACGSTAACAPGVAAGGSLGVGLRGETLGWALGESADASVVAVASGEADGAGATNGPNGRRPPDASRAPMSATSSTTSTSVAAIGATTRSVEGPRCGRASVWRGGPEAADAAIAAGSNGRVARAAWATRRASSRGS